MTSEQLKPVAPSGITGSRAERARMPLARKVLEESAIQHGVCIRPVPLRRYDLATGEEKIIDIPCGATLSSVCPPCAESKRQLRIDQCRTGWHLEQEPDFTPDPATEDQKLLVQLRSQAQKSLDDSDDSEVSEWEETISEINAELAATGVRGRLGVEKAARRVRTTRRRQDASELPKRPVSARTVGKVYEATGGKKFRPSMFLTLTLDSYGRVTKDGTPVQPATYDYQRAARDAIHFARLVDRFVQNLRRFVGFDVQYFAAVEPQRRLAPHLHMAIRGTISRAELREVIAATYHQVWWPSTDEPVYVDQLPEWHDGIGAYVDAGTGEILPTWDQALDEIGPDDEPSHVARFGRQFDAQGVLAGTKDANRAIGYLAKYLTKSVDQCHEAATDDQREHVSRLVEALRYEPCSPTCANWLRYGVQPKNARPGLHPGACRGKAHKATHLGYGGRRVLVSRKWSGKTLTDHKTDRKNWVVEVLGVEPETPAPGRYSFEYVSRDDASLKPLTVRLMHRIAERVEWRRQLDAARHGPSNHAISATAGRTS